MRICHGVYMLPIMTRYGKRNPYIDKVIDALEKLWGSPIVPNGGAAANCLGLTTQNMVRLVLITSGRSRRLKFGAEVVILRHAPRWQLYAPRRRAGELIRALTFLHRTEVEEALDKVMPEFDAKELKELAAARAVIPKWMAEPISARLASG